MIEHLLTQPATITPRTSSTVNGYGTEVLADGTPVETVGFAQQSTEADARIDANQETSEWWVFLPPGTELGRSDRISIAGLDLEVVGLSRDLTRPGPEAHHVEARCRLVDG